VLEHKSGNISETRKEENTMDGLYEVTNALSNGTYHRRSHTPHPFLDWKFATPPPPQKTPIAIISSNG